RERKSMKFYVYVFKCKNISYTLLVMKHYFILIASYSRKFIETLSKHYKILQFLLLISSETIEFLSLLWLRLFCKSLFLNQNSRDLINLSSQDTGAIEEHVFFFQTPVPLFHNSLLYLFKTTCSIIIYTLSLNITFLRLKGTLNSKLDKASIHHAINGNYQ
ncbi:unnamed protein product, partial [Diamesa hyperborea]